MGFESYNLKIQILDDIEKNQIINIFLKMGYFVFDNYTLERTLEDGIIEVFITKNNISLRTAKANNKSIITEIIKDIKTLNNTVQISVYDLQLKQEVSPEHFNEMLSNFNLSHDEFYNLFPNVEYPVRCNDVFKKIRNN